MVCVASMSWPIHDEQSWIYFVQIALNMYDRLELFIDANNTDVVIPLHEVPYRRRRNREPLASNQGPSMVNIWSHHMRTWRIKMTPTTTIFHFWKRKALPKIVMIVVTHLGCPT
ncbi:unnamed protein product [Cuscuta epithymum]|uniref:Uncharacterized protein n=1 Tax=Cuscuta epithymum TaxID=186058 RepID=A0AAV0CUQ9_9ASTE|nr:unnamed protein product [Cuscuta epithymum]